MISEKKAQDIGLALIRISVYVRREELRRRLERLAFDLTERVAANDSDAAIKDISVIEGLIRLGRTIYEIEPMNADILIKELGSLAALMRQSAELSLPDSPKSNEISAIFNGHQNLFTSTSIESNTEEDIGKKINLTRPRKKSSGGKEKVKEIEASGLNQLHNNMADNAAIDISNKATTDETIKSNESKEKLEDPAIRQSAILGRIRQSGNESVQLKDIIAAFPDFSDRTLRYDLQRLCSQGVIERVGQGGPGTYYKLRVIEL